MRTGGPHGDPAGRLHPQHPGGPIGPIGERHRRDRSGPGGGAVGRLPWHRARAPIATWRRSRRRRSPAAGAADARHGAVPPGNRRSGRCRPPGDRGGRRGDPRTPGSVPWPPPPSGPRGCRRSSSRSRRSGPGRRPAWSATRRDKGMRSEGHSGRTRVPWSRSRDGLEGAPYPQYGQQRHFLGRDRESITIAERDSWCLWSIGGRRRRPCRIKSTCVSMMRPMKI